MQQLTIIEGFIPLDMADVIHVQTKFNLIFPSDFIAFLELYQGTSVIECAFPIPDEDDPDYYLHISHFTEVKYKIHNHSIERWLENYSELKNDNPLFDYGIWLNFGSDTVSRNLCYSLNPESFGQIFIYSPFAGLDNPFEFLAPSLEDFVNALYDPNEDEEPV